MDDVVVRIGLYMMLAGVMTIFGYLTASFFEKVKSGLLGFIALIIFTFGLALFTLGITGLW